MASYLYLIGKKIWLVFTTALLLSVVIFIMLRMVPADPLGMMLPPSATADDAEALRRALGMDGSVLQQYAVWLKGALHGNLGNSIFFREPVTQLIAEALPATLELAVVSLFMALLIAIPGGVFLYRTEGKKTEIPADFFMVLMLSIPSFLWGILLIIGFGVLIPVLPFMGRLDPSFSISAVTGFTLVDTALAGRPDAFWDAFKHLVLPALALALSFSPIIARVLRSSLLEVATEPYVAVARLRGVSERRILWLHMLKNAAIPTLTLLGVQFGFLFGGTLLIEIIFSFPGLGNLMVQAIKNFDLPLIQGVALVFCFVVLGVNFCVDALYSVLNPKLRESA